MSNTSIWLIMAGLLLVAEITTGTFYLLMVAIGAFLGALIAYFGYPLEFQIGAASVFAVIASLLLQSTRKKKDAVDSAMSDKLDIGNLVTVPQWDANGLGQVSYRGALWQARCIDASPSSGLHKVVDVQGNLLILQSAATEKSSTN